MNDKTVLFGILAVIAIIAASHVIDGWVFKQLAIDAGKLISIIWEYAGITGAQSFWIALSALCLWYWAAQK